MAVSVSDSSKKPAASPFKKELTPEEKIEQSRMNFMKIITATLKHQNPEKPADTSQITQTMASLHQAEETSRMRAAIDDLRKELSSSKMNKALPFQGKSVRYDTSVKKFDGENPVEFKYQLNFDEKQMPKNAVIISNISILDSKGIKVYQTTGKKEKGVHSLKWSGQDNNGKLNPDGEYRLKVEAFFETNEDGNIVRMPIDSGSFIDGTVESVELIGDKVKLKVNGDYIDIDDIIKIESEKKEEQIKITDYAPYIGQYAEFKDDKLEIGDRGRAKISFETDLV